MARDAPKDIRVGYQNTGVPVIARQQAALEKHFADQSVAVKWVEFSSGPPMLEAINVGSVDFGAVGDSPPIFAQAAGAAIVYAAGSPITNGQGILVPDPPIRTVADLKGKRIGFTKESSAHNVVVQALEKFGLTYSDIVPIYLMPPDAGPAFANGSIEAWAIWDPYFTIGEAKQNGRILINAYDVTKTNSFYITNRDFAKNHGRTLQQTVDVLTKAAAWVEANRPEVARSLAAVTGIPLDIQTIAAKRASATARGASAASKRSHAMDGPGCDPHDLAAASMAGLIPARVMPAPSDVAAAGWTLSLSGELGRNIWV